MSSPRIAAAKTSRRPSASVEPSATPTLGHAAAKSPTRKPAKPSAKPQPGNGAAHSIEAKRLAGEMERALASGRRDILTAEALQALMAAVCKAYAAQVEAGDPLLPLPARGGATATEVMITASGLLKAANLAVFELGMWQSCTGR
jgi:hypothetical protein